MVAGFVADPVEILAEVWALAIRITCVEMRAAGAADSRTARRMATDIGTFHSPILSAEIRRKLR